MRIAVAHGSNDLYGASRVLVEDVSILRHLNHEVCVLLPGDGPLTSALKGFGAEVQRCDLAVLRRVAKRQIRLPISVPAAMSGADLVVLWTLALSSYLPTLWLRRKPTLCSVHEIQPSAAGRVLAAMACAFANRVMANSQATAKWLRPRSGGGRGVVVAYPQAPPYEPLPFPVGHGLFRVLVAGRVNGRKGHLEAVEACNLARAEGINLHLTLVGAPFPGQENHLRDLLRAIEGVSWVTYQGDVPDIRPYLQEAELLLVPSVKPESFGIVALEGWAAGRPVLAAEAGGLAEVADLIGAARFPPADIRAMADSLVTAAAKRREGLPSREASIVEAACSRRQREEAWHDVLASVCDSGGAFAR